MSQPVSKREAARQVVDVLLEISTLLNTHLDHKQLSLCVSLIENGVNPEALADVIRVLRGDGEGIEGSGALVGDDVTR